MLSRITIEEFCHLGFRKEAIFNTARTTTEAITAGLQEEPAPEAT
jgi:hypothetical protein